MAASDSLRTRGLWVPAIRPPTVPKGSSRLRMTFSAAHGDDDVERLLEGLAGLPGRHPVATEHEASRGGPRAGPRSRAAARMGYARRDVGPVARRPRRRGQAPHRRPAGPWPQSLGYRGQRPCEAWRRPSSRSSREAPPCSAGRSAAWWHLNLPGGIRAICKPSCSWPRRRDSSPDRTGSMDSSRRCWTDLRTDSRRTAIARCGISSLCRHAAMSTPPRRSGHCATASCRAASRSTCAGRRSPNSPQRGPARGTAADRASGPGDCRRTRQAHALRGRAGPRRRLPRGTAPDHRAQRTRAIPFAPRSGAG